MFANSLGSLELNVGAALGALKLKIKQDSELCGAACMGAVNRNFERYVTGAMSNQMAGASFFVL